MGTFRSVVSHQPNQPLNSIKLQSPSVMVVVRKHFEALYGALAQWHCGSVLVSHLCDLGLIPAPYSRLIKITKVTCERSVVKFGSTKHRKFAVGTPVSS